jgi:hypothetical protein
MKIHIHVDWQDDRATELEFMRYIPPHSKFKLSSAKDAEWIVLINHPREDATFSQTQENIIFYQMEPSYYRSRFPPPYNKDSEEIRAFPIKRFRIPWLWSFVDMTYEELYHYDYRSGKEESMMSAVSSGKLFAPNHKWRVSFIEDHLSKLPQLKLYGDARFRNLSCYQGGLAKSEKHKPLKSSQYHFAAESAIEPNYVTEKLIEPILLRNFVFYLGDRTASVFVSPKCFYEVGDMSDLEAIDAIELLIKSNTWEKHAEEIDIEAKRILREDSFFPALERHITEIENYQG